MSVKATINKILVRYGFINPTATAQDAAAASKTTISLQAHDKQYHPNGWKPGDTCRLRDSIFNVDDLSTSLGTGTAGSIQQQQQPASQNNADFPTETEFENLIELIKNNPRLVPPQLKQTLDDIPGEIFAMAENQEYLDAAIADLPDGDAKDSLLADQKELDDKRNELRTKFLQTYKVLASILGTSRPTQMKQNPALKHDASAFPTSLDSTPTVNSDGSIDISFDGTSYHFTPCANGSTGPVEGTININGQPKKFILKMSNKPGIRHAVPADALKNEQAANEMLRKAGINAPDSKLFEMNGNAYKLAEFIDNTTPISQTTITDDIRDQLRMAYPLMDLMYSTDLLKDDNVRIDQNGKVWFVDNGSAFSYKGYGDKKSSSNKKWKGFDFEQRNDANGPDLPGNDGNGGTKNYPSHYGALYELQPNIQNALGPMTQKDLLKEASRYNMSALVAGLPKESKCQALIDFAASLDKMSAKAAGTKKIKSSLKQQPATSANTVQNQQGKKGQQNVAIPPKLVPMPQSVAQAISSTGVNLNYLAYVPQSTHYPDHWFVDNLPGASTSAPQIGQLLPIGYSAGWYSHNGATGLVVCKTSDKNNFHSGGWPTGGFQGWVDGTQSSQQQPASAAPTSQSSTTPSASSNSASASNSTVPMTTIARGYPPVPTVAKQLVTGIGGTPYAALNPAFVNGYMFTTQMPIANAQQVAQQLANQLGPHGYTVCLYGTGANPSMKHIALGQLVAGQTLPSNWSATIVQPNSVTAPTNQSSATSVVQQTSLPSSSNGTGQASQSQSFPMSSQSNTIPSQLQTQLSQYGIPMSGVTISHGVGGQTSVFLGAQVTKPLAQTIANNLPTGFTLMQTGGNGSYHVVNSGDVNYWAQYGNAIIAPTASPSPTQQPSQQPVPTGNTQPTKKTASNKKQSIKAQVQQAAMAAAAPFMNAGGVSPSSQSSQQTSPTQPSTVSSGTTAQQSPTGASGQSSSPSSTPNTYYSYGAKGSSVKYNGFNDANVSSDISNLVSYNNWQSKSGKQLIAPGTPLKTQGSLANGGDMYVGFPRGTKQSDITALAGQLDNEYQKYGYNVYAMGNWLSIEKMPTTNTNSSSQSSSTPKASVPSPTPTSSQTSIATVPVGGNTNNAGTVTSAQSSPAAVPSTSSAPSTTSSSSSQKSSNLAQMLQNRIAKAGSQQQARFQAALNRANGNIQSNTQQAAPASQTQQQNQGSNPILTAPKSGNQPTAAQQQAINRFQKMIQNATTPARKAAFTQALSRYYGSI